MKDRQQRRRRTSSPPAVARAGKPPVSAADVVTILDLLWSIESHLERIADRLDHLDPNRAR